VISDLNLSHQSGADLRSEKTQVCVVSSGPKKLHQREKKIKAQQKEKMGQEKDKTKENLECGLAQISWLFHDLGFSPVPINPRL